MIIENRARDLENWLAELESDHRKTSSELELLIRKRDELQQKVELVRKLVSLEVDPLASGIDSKQQSSGGQRDALIPTGIGSIGVDLIDAVREVLREVGRPLHISDIRQELIKRAIPIPGKGTEANIIVYLSRVPSIFERKGRGTYGLAKGA